MQLTPPYGAILHVIEAHLCHCPQDPRRTSQLRKAGIARQGRKKIQYSHCQNYFRSKNRPCWPAGKRHPGCI